MQSKLAVAAELEIRGKRLAGDSGDQMGSWPERRTAEMLSGIRLGGSIRLRNWQSAIVANTVILCIFILAPVALADEENPPEDEVPCSWTGVKCCWTEDLCECCPRDGKETGKQIEGPPCYLVDVTIDDLPISGYLATRECLLQVGPWSLEGIQHCQGSLVPIDLVTSADLEYSGYSFLTCEGGEPYLIRSTKEGAANRTNWGRIKTMYR